MSFEMKYDKNGKPQSNADMEAAAAVPLEQAEQPAGQPDESLANSIEQLNVEAPEQEPTPVEEPRKESYHFKTLREKALLLEKERNEAMERIRQYEALQQERQQPQPKTIEPIEELDEDLELGDDDLTEGKHLKKVMKNLNAKIKKQNEMLKAQQQQAFELATEARIKAQYNDFDSVVNQDNLRMLSIMHPEVASTIYNSTGDLYAKSISAYTMIKNLGIYEKNAEQEVNKELIAKNHAKPRPLTSISPQQGESPLSKANVFASGLTESLKKQLHKEMMDSIKNY